MKIEEYMRNYSIKNKEKVIGWIMDGLIPGANLSDDFIPASARLPYTKARAKKADAIYWSIINATRQRYHVLPQLYKMCQAEFEHYIEQLEKAGLITKRITDDITYYDLTFYGTTSNRKVILEAIASISKGVVLANYEILTSM